MMILNVAVLGAGTMGHGVAHVSALAGLNVRLFDISQRALEVGLDQIRANMAKGVALGKLSEEAMQAGLARIRGCTALPGACEDADLVIEAVPEKLELKRGLLAEVERLLGRDAILGSNTSSLSIAAIGEALDDPGRLIGLHFFNPVHVMQLLEIITWDGTRKDVLDRCLDYGEAIGKQCITIADFPGFATSRLGVCLGMEAIRMVEQGVGSAEDIDKAMVLGYRHPLGPLRLTDLVGLDVRMHIGEYLARALNNPAFEPPRLMKELVAAGKLGKKSGQGFYSW